MFSADTLARDFGSCMFGGRAAAGAWGNGLPGRLASPAALDGTLGLDATVAGVRAGWVGRAVSGRLGPPRSLGGASEVDVSTFGVCSVADGS